jgi:hypothetical protein
MLAYVIGLPRRMDRHELSNVGRLLWKMMELDGRSHVETRFDSFFCRRYVESNLGEGKWRQIHIRFLRLLNTSKSNLRGGISNLCERKSNLRIFDINPAAKFEYRGKSNLAAPELPNLFS